MASISGKAKLAGVMGWPVSHSLSPRLHQFWLSQLGIDGAYVPMAVQPGDIETVMRALPKMGFAGVNLTLPHKELVMPLLATMDDDARIAGMANTIVVRSDGSLHGMNTDSYGFFENIKPHLRTRGTAAVMGAGGAAKAVCHALIKEGFSRIRIANRSKARAQLLASHFGGSIEVYEWSDRARMLAGADLLVNATSLGMKGQDVLELSLDALPSDALVTDIVYTPLQTNLLVQAQARGNPVVDGLGMLLHQAVPGFAAWFGQRPEVSDALRAHVLAGLA